MNEQLSKAQQDLEQEVIERAVHETDLINAKHKVKMFELEMWPTLKGTDTVRRAAILDSDIGEVYRRILNEVICRECSLLHQAAQATIARDRLNVLFAMARDGEKNE